MILTPVILPVASPAAGAQFVFTAPAAEDLLVLSLNVRLVTSAAVANRIMGLNADDGGTNVFYRGAVNFSETASSTVDYSIYAGGGFDGRLLAGVVAASILPAPGLLIPAGGRLRSAVAALDAADQLSAIAIVAGR